MDAHKERIEASMNAWWDGNKACLQRWRPLWRGRSQPPWRWRK
jgi:hypothetical protein